MSRMRAAQRQRARVAECLRRRPEWPLALVVVAAWAALLTARSSHGAAHKTMTVTMGDGSHVHLSVGMAGMHMSATHHPPGAVLPFLLQWALMVVAMMVPATLPAVRHVAFNSIRRRRRWAMTLYLATYVAIWLCFGLVALGAARLAAAVGLEGMPVVATALLVAALWQGTRWKRRALYGCGRPVPLPPVGLRADIGCVCFALAQANRCIVSCWALMGVFVAGHSSFVAMAAVTAFVGVEELTFAGRRLRLPAAGALALAAALVVAAG
jgi:predicted metal-binding membrane protein